MTPHPSDLHGEGTIISLSCVSDEVEYNRTRTVDNTPHERHYVPLQHSYPIFPMSEDEDIRSLLCREGKQQMALQARICTVVVKNCSPNWTAH